jgi:hypothetical protein
MDMAFDLRNPASGRKGDADRRSVIHPNWPELLARMVAARQASASLAKQIHEVSGDEHGSFDGEAAACVASQARLRISVNPNDLGNRKSGGDISSPVAGLSSTGGRG